MNYTVNIKSASINAELNFILQTNFIIDSKYILGFDR